MVKELLNKLANKKDLSAKEMDSFWNSVAQDKISPAQIAAVLLGLKVKGESAEEIAATVSFLRKKARPFKHGFKNAVDNCGTGGDGLNTFNISTAAAILAARAGAIVIKHGNRAVSSKSGSADVLEKLGYQIEKDPAHQLKQLKKEGFTFLFAPLYHPLLKKLAPLRKELGIRTILNLAAPLASPAQVKRQVLGVSDPNLLKIYIDVLKRLGVEQALVLQGDSKMDEISLHGPTQIYELKNKKIRNYSVRPQDFALKAASLKQLSGRSPDENAKTIREIFKGKKGPKADIVALNAGAILYVAGVSKTLKAGVEKAKDHLRNLA